MPSPKRIGKIEFGLLSPKEIRTMSVRKIIWADTYDDDGFPYPQGLMDLNLGVIDPGSAVQDLRPESKRMPRSFRAYRACKTGHPCRVHAADQETPPCDLPSCGTTAPLPGGD